jgi:hypothetical protein
MRRSRAIFLVTALSLTTACAGPREDMGRASAPVAAEPVSIAVEPAPKPPVGRSMAGTWRWRCCDGRWIGGLVLAQEGSVVRGVFVVDTDPTDAGGTAQYVEGQTDGRRLTFTRRWLNQGRLFSQDYTLEVDPGGESAAGTFVENHAPGPPIEFSMERAWDPLPWAKGGL